MSHDRKIRKVFDLIGKQYSKKQATKIIEELDSKYPSLMEDISSANLTLIIRELIDRENAA